MNLRTSRADLHLESSQVVGLVDAAGASVRCLRGRVWITQDRDPRDLVVGAGGVVTLERPGLTLIHALETAEVALSDDAPRPATGILHALKRWVAATFGPESLERTRPGPWHRLL